jgi:HEAT repeat protein
MGKFATGDEKSLASPARFGIVRTMGICYHFSAAPSLRKSTMRRVSLLLLLAGWLLLPGAFADQAADQKEIDETKLSAAKIKADGPALLEFLKSRTLAENERERVDALIAQLGASAFKVREQASQDLIARGPAVLELLRQGLQHPDLEVQRRCEAVIHKIKEKDTSPEVAAAVIRLIGDRKPPGAVEVLIGYLPFADNETMADEIRDVLTMVAVQNGKVDKALTDALKDRAAVRRAAAGQALVLAGAAEQKDAVRALLRDPDIGVRWRVATAQVISKDKEAVPFLIDLLPEASQLQAWQIEDILFRLAEGKSPPAVSLGQDEAGRQKCREAWQAWWKDHSAAADLAVLKNSPRLLGRTTMILLDLGRVIEVEGDQLRWEIRDLEFPLDIQILDNDRILIAEYYGNKVTERDFQGQVLWSFTYQGPLMEGPQMAQRLANGNTFLASKYQMVEVNSAKKQVFVLNIPLGAEGIMKCAKLPTGEITCIFENGRVVRLDAKGKELNSFRVEIGKPLFGGRIAVLPSGRVLIPHHLENKVVEYDSKGKVVWQVKVDQPIVATRLPNGNTLVTSMSQSRVVEFDRNGNEVWQYKRDDSRVTRAVRR